MEEFKNNPDFIGMKIDVLLKKSFISVNGSICYPQHSHLFFGNFLISSQAGVQQGDPLGPFLFCLVLQVLVSKLSKEAPNLALNNW